MDTIKRAKLEAVGWAVGSTQDFLHLSREEAIYVEIKVRLAMAFRARREEGHLTQEEVGKRLNCSPSRVAKMESAHASVSVDLILRGLLGLGGTVMDIIRAIDPRPARA